MTFQELLTKYPYLNECKTNKLLPKVLCKYCIYDTKGELLNSWETPMIVSAFFSHPYMLKDMNCSCINEYDLANHINDLINSNMEEIDSPNLATATTRCKFKFVGWEE